MVTLTTLELLYFDPIRFSADLAEKIQQAPKLFRNLPLVLSLEKLEGDRKRVDFALLRKLCHDQGVQLVGLRTDQPDDKLHADAAGLAILQPTRVDKPAACEPQAAAQPGSPEREPAQIDDQENPAPATEEERRRSEISLPTGPNKIIRTPIRSGQQVYAQGGDLIVLAQVSAGAEILADGNIHVYAPLRGRALAGVQGNNNALIFCQRLEAELVSIAGHYKLSDDLQGDCWKKAARVMLSDDMLSVQAL